MWLLHLQTLRPNWSSQEVDIGIIIVVVLTFVVGSGLGKCHSRVERPSGFNVMYTP